MMQATLTEKIPKGVDVIPFDTIVGASAVAAAINSKSVNTRVLHSNHSWVKSEDAIGKFCVVDTKTVSQQFLK